MTPDSNHSQENGGEDSEEHLCDDSSLCCESSAYLLTNEFVRAVVGTLITTFAKWQVPHRGAFIDLLRCFKTLHKKFLSYDIESEPGGP